MRTEIVSKENYIDCKNGEKYYEMSEFENSKIDDVYFGYMMYRTMNWFRKYKYMFVKFTEQKDMEVFYDINLCMFYANDCIYLNEGEGYLMEPFYIKSLEKIDTENQEIYAHKLELTSNNKILLGVYFKKLDEYRYYEIF